ncbi:MAG: DUF5104 domain-containing protein [Eubacterium sp.]|nr:DUF5104 domain-containing protein [Eubacterium sp.]
MLTRNKTAIIMMLVLLLMLLSGCGSTADLERTNPKKLAKKEAEEIFEYIKAEDINSLVALFSHDVQKTHNLKEEWKNFFEKLDGKAISYESVSFPGEGMGVDKDGNIYDSHLSINYNNVKTDNGTTYTEFGYFQTRIDTAHPDREGINVFTFQMVDKDGNKGEYITVGDYIE